MWHFLKDYFEADNKRRKFLHTTSSNVRFFMHYISEVFHTGLKGIECMSCYKKFSFFNALIILSDETKYQCILSTNGNIIKIRKGLSYNYVAYSCIPTQYFRRLSNKNEVKDQ